MAEHIEGNIYTLNIPLPNNPLRNLNAYLIKDDKRNLLIDTGFNHEVCLEALLSQLEELGVSMNNTDIFLTHMHSDHCGLAPVIAGPDTKMFIGELDYKRLMDEDSQMRTHQKHAESGFPEEDMRQLLDSPDWKYLADDYSDCTPLNAGDILEYGGRKLRVILTPGHTPGHTCLYDAEAEIMFLGDHVLFDITPNITSWSDFDDALGNYIYSLMDINCYDVRLALAAHRSTVGTMYDRIGEIIEHHGARIREMLDALDAHPGLSPYDLSGHMTWRIRGTGGWAGFPTTQKWFAVGETCAHLEYLLKRGRVYREMQGGVWRYYSK